jgi:hypothetical protein
VEGAVLHLLPLSLQIQNLRVKLLHTPTHPIVEVLTRLPPIGRSSFRNLVYILPSRRCDVWHESAVLQLILLAVSVLQQPSVLLLSRILVKALVHWLAHDLVVT